ncbi:MAG: aminodeoxychorismate synthase component I [Betaproteobacteria bacterium]|nr:aminodeoxychorismate synthase component I [Betaproteobacteria bacterium]
MAFEQPRAVHVARRAEEVCGVLALVETAAAQGRWCVGFVAHEAAPAFDAALDVKPDARTPLAWFAEFDAGHAVPAALPDSNAPFRMDTPVGDTPYNRYRNCIETIRADIRDGRFYQVNFTSRLVAAFEGDALTLHRALQAEQPNGYHAFIDTGDGALSSLSPELFFALHGGHVTTQPMKGTAPRGDSAAEDDRIAWALTHSDKERAENLMIVDLLRNDLSRIAKPNSVEVAALFALQPLPSVWQMTSTIHAELREGLGLTDVFRALFPCGSVTGAPKVEAMRAIRDLEAAPRGVYCGAIGFVAPAESGQVRACFNVGIRSLWIESGRVTFGVGGGITFDSTVEGEWAEMHYKARFAVRAAKPFELLETLKLAQGEFALRERHLARMEKSARHFRFAFDRAAVTAALEALVYAHTDGAWRVRLLSDRNGNVRSEIAPLGALASGLRCTLAASAIVSADEFLRHKTTRRESYEYHAPAGQAAFDTLLFNERGELTEFTRANLALEVGGKIFTPPVECGLLNGTWRDDCVARGEWTERVLTREDLGKASRIGWVNSVRGWVDVTLDMERA